MRTKLVSILREFEIVETPRPGSETFVFDSYTYTPEHGLTRYWREIRDTISPWEGSRILMNDGEVIGSGEDPRAFVWQGSPCAMASTYSHGHGHIHKVFVNRLNKWFILIPPHGLAPGKNWMPLVIRDDLYFIHALSPFRLLKARFHEVRDVFMVLDIVAEHDMPTEKSSDGFSQLRGGSNALSIGERVLGFGHTNIRRDPKVETSMEHRPFIVDYIPGKELAYYSLDFDFPDTYKIVDPTSLYQRDGQLFLVTSETEKVWHRPPQIGRICLYSLNIDGAEHENGFGIGRRRLHRWAHGKTPAKRGFLGAWRRPKGARV